jgi:hypothetical protein
MIVHNNRTPPDAKKLIPKINFICSNKCPTTTLYAEANNKLLSFSFQHNLTNRQTIKNQLLCKIKHLTVLLYHQKFLCSKLLSNNLDPSQLTDNEGVICPWP